MRVMQAMAGAQFGGAEAFFVRLAIAFQKAGIDQRVVIRANPDRAALLRAGGVEPVELPFGGAFDLATGRGLKQQVREFKPDVVLTWMNRASGAMPKGDFVHIGRHGGYYDLKYYKNCDYVVGNTQDIVDHAVKGGWPADKARYLPNFVSAETADPLPRKELYTPDSARIILALGRLHENKAFDVLLKACAKVSNVYLWLAGDGPLKADLQKLAEELGIKPRVRFLGWRDDVAPLFAACDLFVCPSRHEPLGNVVIEAWAQGVPVIAADSMGPGTLIEHMANGVLVPVDDPDTLAKAIRGTLEDHRLNERIARAGWETFQRDFTEDAVVNQYLEFFKEVTA